MEPVWWLTQDGDPEFVALHRRHYSRYVYADGRQTKLCVGPGYKRLLRTWDADASWAWRVFIDDCIDERTGKKQEGVNCAIFRNESSHRSSDLVRQADAIADCIWPDLRRHYTYVDPKKVKSKNPGYCFLMAGWRRCGMTKSGLIILERV